MGLVRVSRKDIEIKLSAVVHERRIQEDEGNLVGLMHLEDEEDKLWKAWHRARANDGYARI